MSINKTPRPTVLDGTTGGTVTVDPNYKGLQFSISGRAVDNVAVTVKAAGSDVFQEFATPVVMDLTSNRVERVDGFAVDELKFIPDAAGDDFTVTITQWPV